MSELTLFRHRQVQLTVPIMLREILPMVLKQTNIERENTTANFLNSEP